MLIASKPEEERETMIQTRYASIIARYEAIGRERALTPSESARLVDAMMRVSRPDGRVHAFWSPKEDRLLKQAVLRGRKVPQIAARLGRTERAVWQRMQRLRKLGRLGYISPENGIGRYPRQGSKASRGQIGA
jgi:DNA-binding NarL/FixJ family response regulator